MTQAFAIALLIAVIIVCWELRFESADRIALGIRAVAALSAVVAALLSVA